MLQLASMCNMDSSAGRGDARFSLSGYNMNMLGGGGEASPAADMYSAANLVRPPAGVQHLSAPRHTTVLAAAACGATVHRPLKATDLCYDERTLQAQRLGLDVCPTGGGGDQHHHHLADDFCGSGGGANTAAAAAAGMAAPQSKKSPPGNGKKTKGRVKIKMEYIENKLRRYTTFSKRKTGIMKKAYELSTLTGTQVMLLVASETGHVYTFATRKLQPMITSEAGKALIQTCLNSPDPPVGSTGDQRMSATGFEETELTYNISDEDSKDENILDGETSGSSDGDGDDYVPEGLLLHSDSKTRTGVKEMNVISPESLEAKHSPRQSVRANSPPQSSSGVLAVTVKSESKTNSNAPTVVVTASSNGVASTANCSPSEAVTSQPSTAASTLLTTTAAAASSIMRTSLIYPTGPGMMYATPSNNGMILSLAPQMVDAHPIQSHTQFITIPLSMVTGASNNSNTSTDHSELDLSKRK